MRAAIEIVFVLLGALVIWLGLTGHIFFDRRKASWLILGAAVLLWGARSLYRPGKYWSRAEDWTRGISLLLLGTIIIAISRVPFAWVGPLLAAGGALLLLRGLVASVLVFRQN
ncbi:MAG TPA: hypothetical protein VMT51_08760 [Dongiaceae bacterium]|nr:hypothetical protein [Dongiaceae bacterium]